MVKLTESQQREHVKGALGNLEALCRVFDEGSPYIAFSMATEVRKVLVDSPIATRLRGGLTFSTPVSSSTEYNLLPEMKLVAATISSSPARISFVHQAGADMLPTKRLAFRDWWNKDIIHRAGAAPIGASEPGTVFGNPEHHVPYEKRHTLVRRTFVDWVRNRLGAHLDGELPDLLDELQRSESMGARFGVGALSTLDGTLPMVVGPAAAMMRQVAWEVLDAYAVLRRI
ncbi:MAG: hypothetical protein Q8Q88_23970 [Phenylobacterium sp.]|uniref:hypothetical protein n=1 Tax=Phenylobacterium sp. TaxID=1871053 RepID=UPI002736561B|nr:hypothetical protein [Phenylobacterium sp.]MDP3750094.1 hypothetical protein [Phenylobacterium sp.]